MNTSDTAPRLHAVTENHTVIETFPSRKLAREFRDDYERFYRVVARVVSLDHQAQLGDVV
jgi:hypothetical protein